MDFNLKVGMKDEEFLNTVRGKIAGENKERTQEVLMTQQVRERTTHPSQVYDQFRRIYVESEPFIEKEIFSNPLIDQLAPNFQVVEVKNELQLALIAKRNLKEKPLRISYEYFMMGMDRDTQNMFIHPLHGMPDEMDLDGAYAWSDRTNQGFTHSDRAQGDLLVTLVEDGTTFYFDPFTKHAKDMNQRLGLVYEGGQEHRIFTNHTLKHDGKQYKFMMKDQAVLTPLYIISGATYLMLEHEEHPRYVSTITDNWVALVTAQRGQDSYIEPTRNLS